MATAVHQPEGLGPGATLAALLHREPPIERHSQALQVRRLHGRRLEAVVVAGTALMGTAKHRMEVETKTPSKAAHSGKNDGSAARFEQKGSNVSGMS